MEQILNLCFYMMNWNFQIYFYSFGFLWYNTKTQQTIFFVLFFPPSHIQIQAEERLKKDSLAEGNLLGEKSSYYESDAFICFCGVGIILNLKSHIKLLTEISRKYTLNAENAPPSYCTYTKPQCLSKVFPTCRHMHRAGFIVHSTLEDRPLCKTNSNLKMQPLQSLKFYFHIFVHFGWGKNP